MNFPPPPPYARAPERGRRSIWPQLLLILFVVAFLAGMGLLAMGWLFLGPSVDVPSGSFVELRFDESYPEERETGSGLGAALQSSALSAQELAHALREIAEDPRIRGIVLRPDFYPGGWAQAAELRRSLQAVRERGKVVVAYLETADSIDYYLACAADSILLEPEGLLRVAGLRARMSHLKGSLDKLGVAADYVAVGEFKSAPETLQREAPSEASRRQESEFLDDVYAEWLGAIAKARGLTHERLQSLSDRGEFDPLEAVEEGLVDRLGDLHDLGMGQGGIELLDVRDYLSAVRDQERGEPKLALIHATGTIVPGASGRDGLGADYLGCDTLVEQLQRAQEDRDVVAVVLRIDSPGGSATASDVVFRQLERLRAVKPVVASLGDMAASGGYYVAIGADRIVAEPTSLTGSIGVYAGKFETAKLYEKLGMTHEELLRGENAGAWSELRPFNDAQREALRGRLEKFYERFVSKVAVSRGLGFEAAEAIARGRIWSGRRALQVGLVDELGGIERALQLALELADVPASARPGLRSYQPQPSLTDQMLAALLRGGSASANARQPTPLLDAILPLLRGADRTLDGSTQFHLPVRIRIE